MNCDNVYGDCRQLQEIATLYTSDGSMEPVGCFGQWALTNSNLGENLPWNKSCAATNRLIASSSIMGRGAASQIELEYQFTLVTRLYKSEQFTALLCSCYVASGSPGKFLQESCHLLFCRLSLSRGRLVNELVKSLRSAKKQEQN